MKSWKKPTDEMVDNALYMDKALKIPRKLVIRRYFFARLENPLWIEPLAERGCFKNPPKGERYDDGTIHFPYWPELQYLKNVCVKAPDAVVEIVLQLPETDNPLVYDEILGIAVRLPGKYAAQLKPKLYEYAKMRHQHGVDQFASLLKHWTAENQIAAALELAQVLIAFVPDLQDKEKRGIREAPAIERETSLDTLLYPEPKVGNAYLSIMFEGVKTLAESEPYQTACLLVEATADMIYLRTHRENYLNREDHSDTWCRFLNRADAGGRSRQEVLVHTLTFACEKVFEKSPDQIADLDTVLRKQRWKIFNRLRQYLYARSPSDAIKELIRKEILAYKNGYSRSEYGYEFQMMVRRACEHFGETLLTEAEREDIFEAILEGPSKENYKHWVEIGLGEEFTEEDFQVRQQGFRRKQLRPFEFVLFGKYAAAFKRLEDRTDDSLSDEDYLPAKIKTRFVAKQSPRTSADLSEFSDAELLKFINVWTEADAPAQKEPFVEFRIEALADEFQKVFSTAILTDEKRLEFWLDNSPNIKRPIYVGMMIRAMQAEIEKRNFDRLDVWLTFCEWVLTHQDNKPEMGATQGYIFHEGFQWGYPRGAVVDFIDACLKKEVNVPLSSSKQLASLLKMLCTQFDWRLDSDESPLRDPVDPSSTAINTTRGRALGTLVNFGFWGQRYDSTCAISDVTALLEKRFNKQTEHPLTLPEYAMLGRNYYYISTLDKTWAEKHKEAFFPRGNSDAWVAAFSSFVGYNDTFTSTFEVLREDFSFALKHLSDFRKSDLIGQDTTAMLGRHLFAYYLWEAYSLKGKDSLLKRYYQKTDDNRKYWANLFDDIGHRLRSSGDTLDQGIVDRVIAFFDWRIEQKEATELKHFTHWLQAECLDAEWRLDAYARVLDICTVEIEGVQFSALQKMLPDHPAKVVACFSKLAEWAKTENIYIPTETAQTILNAGFRSRDKRVKRDAEQARDNLLTAGNFGFFEPSDMKDREATSESENRLTAEI